MTAVIRATRLEAIKTRPLQALINEIIARYAPCVKFMHSSVAAMLTMKDEEGVRFLSSWSGKALDVINVSYNDVLSGKVDAKTGLDAIAAKVNEIIKASK